MSYKRLGGKEFKNIFSYYVIKYFSENIEYLNNLNVFPVPDGDTGTNMNLTLLSAVKKIENLSTSNIAEVIKNLSKGMLLGARGNSGVILSQIWRGISQEINSLEFINIEQFAYALKSGSKMAYSSVMRPIEGTILTVMRDMSEVALKEYPKHKDFVSFLEKILNSGKKSLAKTKQILPALKEANVVDSGAQGLIFIFEGILLGLSSKSIDEIKSFANNTIKNNSINNYSNDNYGYCTEIVLKLNEKDIDKLAEDKDKIIEELNNIGNSLVFVNDDEMLKIHIHTLDPFGIFEKFKHYGEYIVIKAENMKHQVEQKNNAKENKTFNTAIITVASGKGINKCFKELGAAFIIQKNHLFTPSTEEFLNALSKVNAKEYILMPNDNNILLLAQQVQSMSNKKIFVLPTRTMQEGIASCISFKPELSAQENMDNMLLSMKNTKSGCISKAVKSVTTNGRKVVKGDYIGICKKNIVDSDKNIEAVLLNLLEQMHDSNTELITLYEGKEADKKITDKLMQKLREVYKNTEISKIYGGQEIYYYLISCE